MATYVLVSGAWHAAWCWERVIPLLQAQGHEVLAPDLAGTGSSQKPPAAASLARWADQIANVVREQVGPVILVGHSRGGIVISETAERVPHLIETLVYVAAFLVPAGRTLLETSARAPSEPVSDILILQDDKTTVVRPESVGPIFYSSTDRIWVDRAKSLLGPEPTAMFSTPLNLTAQRYGKVKRAYIECEQDKAVPVVLQRLMQKVLPCAPVFTLDTDHSPFYSAPAQLATCLNILSRC